MKQCMPEENSPMYKVYEWTTYAFDPLHAAWASDLAHRMVAGVIISVFLGTAGLVELNRIGALPAAFGELVGHNRFLPVNAAFTLLLVLEVVELIFTLPCSTSKSMGKQLEIMSLILLRDAFKELSEFSEPLNVMNNLPQIATLGVLGLGAFAIFVLLGLYSRMVKKRAAIRGGAPKYCFVTAKKLVALVLLALFVGLGGTNFALVILDRPHFNFFSEFYSLLIFSDLLLVLIVQRFFPSFHIVFRNSGYALATLVMRLALAAPPYYASAMGTAAALFVVLLTLAYNAYFAPVEGGGRG